MTSPLRTGHDTTINRLRRLLDSHLHGASQDAVKAVLCPQQPTGVVGTGGTDFGAHYMDHAFDLDSHTGFKSVHTLFSLLATQSSNRLVSVGVKRVSKTPCSASSPPRAGLSSWTGAWYAKKHYQNLYCFLPVHERLAPAACLVHAPSGLQTSRKAHHVEIC